MSTSGILDFSLTFDDILQDAAGMVGGGPILADELTSAQRGLDQLLISVQNRGLLLHKIKTSVVPAAPAVATYTFNNAVIDAQKILLRDSNDVEIELERLGFERWAELPTKTQSGRPTAYWFDRQRNGSVLNVWPVPDISTYSFVITYQQAAEQTVRAFNEIDVPRRFWPALTFGLAYWIGLRRPGRVPPDRLAVLRTEYEMKLREAMQEDRERASFFIKAARR